MMNKLITSFVFSMIFSGLIFSQSAISDVPPEDASYRVIKETVDEGYLSLFEDASFQANRAISRRELALIIDKLHSEMDGLGITLSKAELQELSNLAKRFKAIMADFENYKKGASSHEVLLADEQRILNYQISSLEERIQTLINEKELLETKVDRLETDLEEEKVQRKRLWFSVIVVGLLGIAI